MRLRGKRGRKPEHRLCSRKKVLHNFGDEVEIQATKENYKKDKE